MLSGSASRPPRRDLTGLGCVSIHAAESQPKITMKKLILVLVLFAAPAFAQDGIDLSAAVWHGTPNVSGWPITVSLESVEFKPGRESDGNTVGVRPIFNRPQMNARWPEVRPVGWEGTIQFTIAACVRPQSVWHCAGLHEFWSDRNGAPRVWTGAPILTQWYDWVYRGQWGSEMEAYRPKLGDEIVFGLIAGDRRLMDLGEVRERSNFVRVPIVEAGIPVPLSTVPSVPTEPKEPGVPSLPPVDPGYAARLDQIEQRILLLEQLRVQDEVKDGQTRDEVGSAFTLITALTQRIEVLETRPVIKGCRASLSGIIPISCRLE